jgi:hypothetical protein
MIEIFSLDERKKINSILSLIIPAGDTGMPEAQLILKTINLDIPSHIKFVEVSKAICDRISVNQINNEKDLNLFQKNNFRDFSIFVNMVLILYYSNIIVLQKLGVGSVPPFPDGNFVKDGDIYLLEQVFLKDKIYKD